MPRLGRSSRIQPEGSVCSRSAPGPEEQKHSEYRHRDRHSLGSRERLSEKVWEQKPSLEIQTRQLDERADDGVRHQEEPEYLTIEGLPRSQPPEQPEKDERCACGVGLCGVKGDAPEDVRHHTSEKDNAPGPFDTRPPVDGSAVAAAGGQTSDTSEGNPNGDGGSRRVASPEE